MSSPESTVDEVPYVEHLGDSRQYWRDIILGVNDGLVSMFLLVAGVVGGGLDTKSVLLTGIAGAIAGAVSMGVGEYIATKSQEEVFEREIALEREHLEHHRDREIAELKDLFRDTGLKGDIVNEVVDAYDKDDEALMNIMMALEFGVLDHTRRSPYVAMAASAALFLAGSMTSVLPFAFSVTPNTGLFWAAVGSSIALFLVGALKTWATKGNWLRSGGENFLLATAGAVLSYYVGDLYQRTFG
ncbi:MAG: VIT1/CCC1 transporter family protein [Acidimicrobiia bacterium]|nr:VIT1/CCC1 transporter family protein [Acidimicrobiia bacterium]